MSGTIAHEGEAQEQANRNAYAQSAKHFPAFKKTIDKELWDVVIVGAGPGGLFAAATLARYGLGAQNKILLIDARDIPTAAGRADGVQPRTLEIFRNMPPIGDEMISRGSHCYERTFWNPDESGTGIERTRRVQSCPVHLDTEEPYTLGVQQGLVERAFLRDMDRHETKVTRAYRFEEFTLDPSTKSHPVHVTLINEKTQEKVRIRTQYLIGADGGRSAVRNCMSEKHGVKFEGDWVDTLWGAIDAVVETDFPDIRKIAAIHSKNYGSLMIFPREYNDAGRPVVRLYTQINRAMVQTPEGNKVQAKDVKVEDIMETDKKIFAPYKLTFREIEWWTAYPIGQRLASTYDIANRVFIAGDACHTHSPKAGQGMNTSIIDGQNLAWKIALVDAGLASPSILSTYNSERRGIGKQLVDFDSEFSALFSGENPKNSKGEVMQMNEKEREAYFIHVQRRNAEFSTGLGVYYGQNPLNAVDTSYLGFSPIQTKLVPGRRLETGMVTRFLNSEPCKIIHEVKFDAPGGFRIYVLGGKDALGSARLAGFAAHLRSPHSFLHRFHGAAPYSYDGLPEVCPGASQVNPYFCIMTIIPKSRFAFELSDLKDDAPLNTHVYADDYAPNSEGDEGVGGLHKKWGMESGIVICRPDGYVGCVAPLSEAGWLGIEKYFNEFLVDKSFSSKL